MVLNAFKTIIAPALGAQRTLTALQQVRERTLMLVSHLSADDLRRVHCPLMSPLVWDLAHIAAYEDLWLVHRHVGEPLLRADLAAVYDAFETPRCVRGEVKLLDVKETFEYMAQVRLRIERAVERAGVGDGLLHELVLRHELQHTETMLQTMALSGLLPEGLPPAGGGAQARPEWIRFAGGQCDIGAQEGRFAYDNERPRHTVALDPFTIARDPVTVCQWSEFEREGGYRRRELWSQEGWEWAQSVAPARDPTQHASHPAQQAPHPAQQAPHPTDAVCHVCFHEAQAYARFRGARLPSEAEWEHAATAEGCPLRGVGRVWEWTSTVFDGYPGFVAHPYREYSEVFFRKGYRVLRGGSWATHARVATATFRNWDLPQRRQIFAGLRLGNDAAGR